MKIIKFTDYDEFVKFDFNYLHRKDEETIEISITIFNHEFGIIIDYG